MTVPDAASAPGLGVPNPPRIEVTLRVGGMTCASCATRLERVLQATPGVDRAQVQLVHELARILVVPGTPIESLAAAVAQAGFEVRESPKAPAQQLVSDEQESRQRLHREGIVTFIGLALAVPLVLPMFLMLFGLHFHPSPWVELGLVLPLQFGLGMRFYRSGFNALRHGAGNMELLVALGTTAAFGYSLALLLVKGAAATTGQLYFESAAVVIALVRFGKWLELRAKRSTFSALRELLALRPETARLRRSSGDEIVPADSLQVGDIIVALPGERIAADGWVSEGSSGVDESLVTGESLPVEKSAGTAVFAGTLNGTGRLVLQVSQVGETSLLGRIVDRVYAAQGGKAAVQQLVDRISNIFVPSVLGLALLTGIGWVLATGSLGQATGAAISVLVVACPCALGLATPTAVVAGTGAAAKAGILVRDIDTLERLAEVTVVVFDKTGTVTEGRPSLAHERYADADRGAELLALAAALQQGSEHPLAAAMVAAARQRGLALVEPQGVSSLVGRGVSGQVSGRALRIGSREFLVDSARASGLASGEELELQWAGHSVVGLEVDGQILAWFGIADPIRDTARPAVEALRRLGISAHLLSGDAVQVAESVGRALELERSTGRVSPEGKQDYIESLRSAGQRVAMVGDGLNDAPALAAAAVGIAMGSGTAVAIETASVVLLRPDPRLVASAVEVARATRRKIRQNLGWAFGYNIVALPLAAFGRLDPMVAGAAMAFSSVSVVTSSLLLRRWRPRA